MGCYDDVRMPFEGVETWQTEVEALLNLNSSALRSQIDAGLWLESMLQEYKADS